MRARFRKMDKRYPLKTFRAYLETLDLAFSTQCQIIGAIRQMLYGIEKASGQFPPPWRDYSLVLAYYQSLSRFKQNALQAAWTHFLGYAATMDPALDLPRLSAGGERGPRDTLAAAVRLLIDDLWFQKQRKDIKSINNYVWRRIGDANDEFPWRVVDRADGQTMWPLSKFRPLLEFILEWGYPKPGACTNGARFIPRYPHSEDAPSTRELYRLHDEYFAHVEMHIGAFEIKMKEAEQASVAALATPRPVSSQ